MYLKTYPCFIHLILISLPTGIPGDYSRLWQLPKLLKFTSVPSPLLHKGVTTEHSAVSFSLSLVGTGYKTRRYDFIFVIPNLVVKLYHETYNTKYSNYILLIPTSFTSGRKEKGITGRGTERFRYICDWFKMAALVNSTTGTWGRTQWLAPPPPSRRLHALLTALG